MFNDLAVLYVGFEKHLCEFRANYSKSLNACSFAAFDLSVSMTLFVRFTVNS
jgi:hypothetical protein